ncbi:MAG: 16S rRNA pseudouridine(516) synthase RsuA [Pseudohongiellaceae bacterium]|nr:16S rRNA pseudouridine(516) synthase RsuA [Pseudohongiellaceae bacterium]
MRLDKFISHASGIPRDSAKRAIRKKEVLVNGEIIRSAAHKVSADDIVHWNSQLLALSGPRYIMLHKPQGYICATEDGQHPTVLDLLAENPNGLSIAGRLDIDTTGLVLITDDGQWLHRVISPKHKCKKTYIATLEQAVSQDTIEQFAKGILLKGEDKITAPAQLTALTDTQVEVVLSEGRYHQVKRMFAACGNHVLELHRNQIGTITLDETLEEGEYRALTATEVASIFS